MLALALLTFYLDRTVQRGRVAPRRCAATTPTTCVTNFTTTTYNRDGARRDACCRRRRWCTTRTTTPPSSIAPRVVQTKPDEPRVTVRADRGKLVARRRGDLPLRQRGAGARGRRRARPRGAPDHRVPARGARPLAGAHRPRGEDRRGEPLAAAGAAWNTTTRRGQLHAAAPTCAAASRPSCRAMKRCAFLLAAVPGRAAGAAAEKADRDKPTAGRGEPHERRRRAPPEHLRRQRGADQGHHARAAPSASSCARTPRATSSPPPPASRCASASARTRSRRRRKASGWTARRCASRSTSATGKIELFENARVNRGGDEVAGNYIFVDQRSDFFR